MKKVLISVGFVFIFYAIVFSRGSGSKFSTPVFDDWGTNIEVVEVRVGSETTVVGSTTTHVTVDGSTYPFKMDDIRRIDFYNQSNSYRLHISSGFLTAQGVLNSSVTYVLDVSTAWNSHLTLSSNATFFFIYEAGASTQSIRLLRRYNK